MTEYEPGPYLYKSPRPDRCCADVGDGWRTYQCSNPAKYRETYRGEERGFCGTHRPSQYVKDIVPQFIERMARWDAERERSLARCAREDKLRAARKLARETLETIAQHNGEHAELARFVLAQYPDSEA